MDADAALLADAVRPTTDRRGPGIIAAAATGIVEYTERLGGDIDTIFGNAGIDPAVAGAATLKLKLSDFCRLFEEAAGRTGAETFGLWFGNQFQPRQLGLWGYAAVSAPTLGSALETLVDLFRHHQESSRMLFRRDADGFMRLEYRIEAPAILDRRQDAELSLGMFLNVVREACGPAWSPEEVQFEHPGPARAAEHERAFGAPVYFAQRTNALVFRPDVLGTRMPACDLGLMTIMRTCLEQLSEARPAPLNLADSVRTAIRARLPEGCPRLERIADDLRVPPAAVTRALAREGATFADTVERTRRGLAMSYLRQEHLPLSEIALLLGYSELSAFSRAVRRWTGVPPRKLREGLAVR